MTGHVELASGRWATLTLAAQLANVGSEVDRASAARDARRPDRCERALARALELFDLTAADARWRGPRLREILRAREEFCGVFFGAPAASGQPVSAYLLQFARLARSQIGVSSETPTKFASGS